MTRTRTPLPPLSPRPAITLLALAALAGCASQPTSNAGINTGLDALAEDRSGAPVAPPPSLEARPGSIQALAEQSAVNLQAVLDGIDRPAQASTPNTPASMRLAAQPPAGTPPTTTPTPPSSPTPPTAAPDPSSTEVTVTAETLGNPPSPVAPAPETADAPPPPPPAPEKPLGQKIDEAAITLVDLLRQRAATDPDPRPAYLALAGLEALRPGASQQVITPETIGAGPLHSDDQATVESLRELVTTLVSAPPTRPLPLVMRDLGDRLCATQPVRIGAARLCTRVLGFGRFTPYHNERLMQGRPHRVIVYTEVASFGQRTVTETEAQADDSIPPEFRPRFAVDLTQELQLYHDADGVLVWSQPEQRICETSLNRRRDFYLVQQITLPDTLTLGAYALKVVIRDRTTASRDELNIPLQVVTDPTMTTRAGD